MEGRKMGESGEADGRYLTYHPVHIMVHTPCILPSAVLPNTYHRLMCCTFPHSFTAVCSVPASLQMLSKCFSNECVDEWMMKSNTREYILDVQENLTLETKYKPQGLKVIFWFQKIKPHSKYIGHFSRERNTTGCTCPYRDLFEWAHVTMEAWRIQTLMARANRLETQGGAVVWVQRQPPSCWGMPVIFL